MLDQNFLESEMKKVDYQFRHVLGVPSSNMMATMKTLKKNIKKIFIYFAIFISGCIFSIQTLKVTEQRQNSSHHFF